MDSGMMRDGARAGAGCLGPFLGLVAVLALVAVLFDQLRAAFDPMQRDADYMRLLREQRMADDLYKADLWAGWAWRLVPTLAAGVFLCGLAVVVLVILYRQLAAWQTIRARHMIALTRAQTQRFPEGLQTLAFHDSSRDAPMLAPPAWGEDVGDEDAEEGGEDAERVGGPPFEELLDEFGPGRPRILGRDLVTGELVRLTNEELYNVGVGGASGAGKSWTIAALSAQHILAGGKLIIIDPHGRKPEGLTPRLMPFAPAFFCAPAIDPPDVAAVVKMVRSEVQKRKGGRGGKPWLVVVDEYAALMRSSVAEEVGAMVEELGQEGRGFGLTALVSSQVWNGTRAGGSEVRDALASHIVHRLRPAQARMLTGLPAEALPGDLWQLPRGVFYLLDGGGELRRVAAPRMSEGAVAKVAELLSRPTPQLEAGPALVPDVYEATPTQRLGDTSGTRRKHVENTSGGDVYAASGSAMPPRDPETARLLARFADGASVHELASEIASTDNTNAKAYRLARGRVEALLRGLVPGGEA